jgi:hypothetical protein
MMTSEYLYVIGFIRITLQHQKLYFLMIFWMKKIQNASPEIILILPMSLSIGRFT